MALDRGMEEAMSTAANFLREKGCFFCFWPSYWL